MSKLSPQVLVALAATAELCGTQLTPAAATLMAQDLEVYPQPVLLVALSRCRREVKGRLTLADIIERIEDGRPGPDEAWAQVGTTDETRTIVTTTEALQARGLVAELLKTDEVGARMAFRDAYKRIVAENRANGSPVEWTASLGHDKQQRETALREALEDGRLNAQSVKPFGILDEPKGQPLKLLPGKNGSRNELAVANFDTLLMVLDGKLSAEEAEAQIERRFGGRR